MHALARSLAVAGLVMAPPPTRAHMHNKTQLQALSARLQGKEAELAAAQQAIDLLVSSVRSLEASMSRLVGDTDNWEQGLEGGAAAAPPSLFVRVEDDHDVSAKSESRGVLDGRVPARHNININRRLTILSHQTAHVQASAKSTGCCTASASATCWRRSWRRLKRRRGGSGRRPHRRCRHRSTMSRRRRRRWQRRLPVLSSRHGRTATAASGERSPPRPRAPSRRRRARGVVGRRQGRPPTPSIQPAPRSATTTTVAAATAARRTSAGAGWARGSRAWRATTRRSLSKGGSGRCAGSFENFSGRLRKTN